MPTAPESPTPSSTVDPLADWQVVETQDGLYRWRIPADWTAVDESFEAEDGLGWVNQVTIVSELDQELAEFGSAYYGDRGGACEDWDGDGATTVPTEVHLEESVRLGDAPLSSVRGPVDEGRIVAFTSQSDPDTFEFYAGYSQDAFEDGKAQCLRYSDVPVPEDYPDTAFGTTADRALWQVDSFEQGTAYTETQEYAELIDMFRSLELTGTGS